MWTRDFCVSSNTILSSFFIYRGVEGDKVLKGKVDLDLFLKNFLLIDFRESGMVGERNT